MSAWLCSDKHIFELAKYYVDKCQSYSSNKMSFFEAVEELHKENVRSLCYRYSDDDYEGITVPANYIPTVSNIFAMAKLVDCYSYQACEHPEWEDSRANKMCESIKYHLLSNHPDYEAAPWGIE